ncbi:MAG: tetratricopeptide domain-containing protein, partial [Stygiobacter sp.]
YVRARQPEKAQELLTDLLEKNPTDANMNAAMAELYLQKNDWKNAERHLSVVLKNDTLEADVRFRIGIAYYSQSQKDSSLLSKTYDLFKKFTKQYPADWRALLYCGVIARASKEDSSAQIYFTRATQVANWNPDTWWQLGWLFFDKQNFNEAITVMEKAKQYLPNEFRVHLLLGIVYSRAQRNQEARIALERAVELNPNDLNALSSLGLTYDALKMHAESDSSYERALRIDSTYPLVLNNYAYSLSERGLHLERAVTMSKTSLQKDSLNPSYLDTYGWILFQNKKYEEALIYIKKAVDLGEVSAVVLEHLGDVYAKLHKLDDAKKYWNKALELDKKNAALQSKIERGTL